MSENNKTTSNATKDFPFMHASLLVIKFLLDGIMENESFKSCHNEKFATEVMNMDKAVQTTMSDLYCMVFPKEEMRKCHSLSAIYYINEVYSYLHDSMKKKMLEEYEALVGSTD